MKPQLTAADLEAYWMPYTAKRSFKGHHRIWPRVECAAHRVGSRPGRLLAQTARHFPRVAGGTRLIGFEAAHIDESWQMDANFRKSNGLVRSQQENDSNR